MITEAKLRRGRPLSPEEREVFLLREAEAYTAKLRRMRDEAERYPELMVTYGFAAVPHPPTPGLMSYLHDPVRQESARAFRQENADRADCEVQDG